MRDANARVPGRGKYICRYRQPAGNRTNASLWTTTPVRKLKTPDVFKAFKAATENGAKKRACEVITDNVCKMCMEEWVISGKRRGLSATRQYHRAWSRTESLNGRFWYSPMRCVSCCMTLACPNSRGQRRSTRRHRYTMGRTPTNVEPKLYTLPDWGIGGKFRLPEPETRSRSVRSRAMAYIFESDVGDRHSLWTANRSNSYA